MVEAYILIQTEVGKSGQVAAAIAEISGVISSEAVTGPYDAIIHFRADDVDAVAQKVVNQIQAVPGITRTLTCPIVKL